MKTPREILLDRQRSVQGRLDAIRREVVRNLEQPAEPAHRRTDDEGPQWWRGLNILWRELIQPSRRVWSGLAAVWLLLLVINLSGRDNVSSVTGLPVQAPAVALNWQAQQRWVNELLADRAVSMEADGPRQAQPRPHSEYSGAAAV